MTVDEIEARLRAVGVYSVDFGTHVVLHFWRKPAHTDLDPLVAPTLDEALRAAEALREKP